MPYSKYVDSGFHVLKSQDKYANQPPYIDPGTSHPQTMHDLVYVDSGGHMNPHDQYINQSYDIVPQGPPHPQNTHHPMYIDPIPYVNPDDQYTNQQHDTDLQAISHPQITHVSTYNDSMPHAKPHNQQLTTPPAHGFVSDTYYHTPHPKMSYERPDPLIQSSDWMHGLFDVHNAGNGVEGGPSVDLEPAAKHHHDFNHLCYHQTSSQHTPYTVSKRRNNYLTPRDVEHGEGSSHSTAQSVLPLVLDTQPVTIPSPVVPKALSPIPVALLHVADLSKVKSAALFQMKCTIFINSFFLDVATVGKMARKCMDAKVSHDDDLVTWSKTSDGEFEVSKLCKALGTIKKNIQFLSHSVVLWGYDLHYILMEKPKKEVKEFVSTVSPCCLGYPPGVKNIPVGPLDRPGKLMTYQTYKTLPAHLRSLLYKPQMTKTLDQDDEVQCTLRNLSSSLHSNPNTDPNADGEGDADLDAELREAATDHGSAFSTGMEEEAVLLFLVSSRSLVILTLSDPVKSLSIICLSFIANHPIGLI
ncbi:hypothetical protein BD769DRAFT_1669217 [Suillus cothurnatus]|nr:hypothetical protein BD769DRAFT_1669217 [Suillus cothurnatus]